MTVELELRRILRAVKTRWHIAAILAIIVAGLLFGYGTLRQPVYVTEAEFAPSQSFGVFEDSTDTYRLMVVSDAVLKRVIADLGLDVSREQLANRIVTHVIPGTSIIQIQVRGTDAQQTADIANALVVATTAEIGELRDTTLASRRDNLVMQRENLTDQITTIDEQLEEIQRNGVTEANATQVETLKQDKLRLTQQVADLEGSIRSAHREITSTTDPIVSIGSTDVPTKPEAPSTWVLTALGLILGVSVGGLVILWQEYRDRTIRDPVWARQVLNLPLIASLHASESERAITRLAAQLAVIAESGDGKLAVVSPVETDIVPAIEAGDVHRLVGANGVLQDATALKNATSTARSVLLVEDGRVTEDQLKRVVALLAAADVAPTAFIWSSCANVVADKLKG